MYRVGFDEASSDNALPEGPELAVDGMTASQFREASDMSAAVGALFLPDIRAD